MNTPLASIHAELGEFDKALPLAQRALELGEKTLGSEHPAVAQCLTILADLYTAKGELTQTLQLYQRSANILENSLGAEHPVTAIAMAKLARVLTIMGDFAQAESLLNRALAILEKKLGSKRPETAGPLTILASIQRARGQHDQALTVAQRATAIAEGVLGPDHPHTAITLVEQAQLYLIKGEFKQALLPAERSLAIREKALGSEHILTAESLTVLALVHGVLAEVDQALPLAQRAFAIAERVVGDEHPRTGVDLLFQASLLARKGDTAQALPLQQRALTILENALIPENPGIAQALHKLTDVYQVAELVLPGGDLGRATRFSQRLLVAYEKLFGPEHPLTAQALSMMASMRLNLGQYADALRLLRKALSILGSDHPESGPLLAELAQLYRLTGEHRQALPLAQRALEVSEKMYGSENPNTAASLMLLARAYTDVYDFEQAIRCYQRAVSIVEKTLVREHWVTGIFLGNLAELYRGTKEYPKAIPLALRALAIALKAHGPDHDVTAMRLNNLASYYHLAGNPQQASKLLRRALEIIERRLGAEHPQAALTLNNLGLTYYAMNDYVRALGLYQRALGIYEKTPGHEKNLGTSRVLQNLALLHWDTGNYEDALDFFRRASVVEDHALTELLAVASEEQKLRFIEQARTNFLAALSLIHQQLQDDRSALRFGLELVLRRKGVVLDTQSQASEAIAARLEGETLESWQRLQGHRRALSNRILHGPAPQSQTDDRKTIDDLSAAIVREEQFLAQHSPVVAQTLFGREVKAQKVAERLPKDSALVEFVRIRDWDEAKQGWSATDRYLAFVLTPEARISFVDLGEAEAIDAKIQEAMRLIGDPEPHRHLTKTNALLSDLYDLLLHPANDVVSPYKRLILSPDGDLHKVPFAALRTRDGHYLIEERELSYVTSGRDLLRGKTVSPTIDLLVVANPDFDDREAPGARDLSPSVMRAGGELAERWGPLPGFELEARLIPSLVEGTRKRILQGKQATESNLLSSASPRVLHLATHGFFLKDRAFSIPDPRDFTWLNNVPPRGLGGVKWIPFLELSSPPVGAVHSLVRSGLVLAGANHASTSTKSDDGLLTALEVTGMNLYGTDLVVLSACETALGEIIVGEGVYGLRRAFSLAGATNLMMSLWSVDDKLTVQQMVDFYRAYSQGKSPAYALRQSQLNTIATLRQYYQARLGEPLAPVKLWAPFIVHQRGE